MKTYIALFYVGTIVHVVGPVDAGIEECRRMIEDRALVAAMASSTRYREEDLTVGCFRMARPPRIGDQT